MASDKEPFLTRALVKNDATKYALYASHNHLNDLPVNKGRPPRLDIIMNTWHGSVDILNYRFILQQGPEVVDQVCKTGQNMCEKTILFDTAVNLCLPEILPPLLTILCPCYALLHIPPRQFCVNLTII